MVISLLLASMLVSAEPRPWPMAASSSARHPLEQADT
jgi:hypothetical protein